MKTRLLILAITAAVLSSCSHYKLTSVMGDDHPCYSTWHPYPKNN
ncbi:hypothetical protein [Prosthecobacter sp.]|nr:hypothetical protein [Prosthecobacter sp.]MDI1311822.1 hypothetical protein [Prosthecobacter sp.]